MGQQGANISVRIVTKFCTKYSGLSFQLFVQTGPFLAVVKISAILPKKSTKLEFLHYAL